MLHNHLSSMGIASSNKGNLLEVPAQHKFAALHGPNRALLAHVFMLWLPFCAVAQPTLLSDNVATLIAGVSR